MPTLSQKEIALRSALAAALYHVTSGAPTPDDDRNLRYIKGSRWIDLLTQDEYVCVSNEPTAAVWKSTTSGGSGGGSTPHFDAAAPTVGDDAGDGYLVGQLWVHTTSSVLYVCSDNTVGAAVWINVSGSGSTSGAHTATVDPTTADDGTLGYVIGQLWVNTVTDDVFVCTDTTTAAAVWVGVGSSAAATAASDVTADADTLLTGTTVQSQLSSISTILRGATLFSIIPPSIGLFGVVTLDPTAVVGLTSTVL